MKYQIPEHIIIEETPDAEARAVMNQYTVYTQRWINELPE